MREIYNLCLESGMVGFSQTGADNWLRRTLAEFFIKIIVRQPIGRKDSLQAVCQRMSGLDGFLYEAAKNFELFLKNSKIKIKKSKICSG
jgi:hypothetical protein